jgi:hypothetical protein
LIRKLRWIGLKEEAKRLEMALSTVRAGQRNALAGQAIKGPERRGRRFNTDIVVS